MTLTEEAEAELKAGGDDFVHLGEEGAAICRVVERRLAAMSGRIHSQEKRGRGDWA